MGNDKWSEEECETFQKDELDALEAIFCDDLKKVDGKQGWRALEVQITLLPMVSMNSESEAHVGVDLYVRCGKRYPNVIPDEISLKNPKGLSSAACDELKNELYELAKTMRGEVMIFQMTDHVRQFLHQHNRPIPKSFYDEMLSNKIKQEKNRLKEMERMREMSKLKEEEQSKLLEEELQKKKHALMEESRLRRESLEVEETPDESVTSQCTHFHGTAIIYFKINSNVKKIQRCRCFFHCNERHFVDYFAVDPESGELYVMSEWILEREVNSQQKAHITNVEKNFNSKVIGLTHSNLISYLSIKTVIEASRVTVYALREHTQGSSSFSLLIPSANQLNINLLKNCCKDILRALNHLHAHKCAHQDLKVYNVYFDQISQHFKLSGQYIEKQMSDLFSQSQRINLNADISDVNIYDRSREDSYLLGLFLLRMIKSDKSMDRSIDPNEILSKMSKDRNIDQDLFDFLVKCLESDKDSRWTAKDLLQHNFITSNKPIHVDHSVERTSKVRDEVRNQLNNKRAQLDEEKSSKMMLNAILPPTSAVSRFANEFEVIEEIGKGGFGCVYKVRNLLDGGIYALKKIPINPNNLSLNKKMNREVTLQTRLYHENIVRYFSSWVEKADIDQEPASTVGTITETSPEEQSNVAENKNDENSDEDEENEAEEDIFRTSFFLPSRQSSGFSDENYVVFERSHTATESESVSVSVMKESEKASSEEKKTPIPRQFMYIQMELCNCGTLKDAIDQGLYNDHNRKRRLLREIVEGLVHIHQQGMIHRDLKPGNIFLDYNDHVKIGDFGLATTELVLIKGENQEMIQELKSEITPEMTGKFKVTGIVGTPLYIAPELTNIADVNSNKIMYTQKVDIYSLGIILFEMSYPFQTSMERTKVIMNLRKAEIMTPRDIDEHLTQMEIDLIRNLLQHDSSMRPSSSELLDSEYLPGPEMEEREELNIIRRTVLNPGKKTHKYMLNLLFHREYKEVEDIVYDINEDQFATGLRVKKSLPMSMKQRLFNHVNNSLQKIMHRHCALSLPIPTLIHKHSTSKYNTDDLFIAMDQNGTVVTLPYDLRVPFARYVARNKITHIRRYSIEKVYRQRRFQGYHPKELWECAFDIVAPRQQNSTQLMPDVETLCVLNEVVNEFPMLQGVGLTLKINHIKLLKSIFLYCDIPEMQHNNVMKFLSESWTISTRSHSVDTSSSSLGNAVNNTLPLLNKSFLKKKLTSQRILTEENRINTLLQLLELEQDNVKKLMSNIKTHMRRKGDAQQNALELAKKSLKEIENVLSYAERIAQLKFAVKISPGFILSGTQFNFYSDIIFQLEREVKRKKQSAGSITSVIAIGGRYDELITRYDVSHGPNSESHKKLQLGAVGISIGFEKIVKCVMEEENGTNAIFGERIDVVLCSLSGESSDSIAKEFCLITKDLSSIGMKVFCFPEDLPKNIEDLHAFCWENAVRYALVLKESDYYQTTAKLIAYEKERFIDKKGGPVNDVVDHLIKQFNAFKNESSVSTISEQSLARNESSRIQITTSESSQSSSTLASNIKLHFIITSEKLQSQVNKRRYEGLIVSLLASSMSFINSNNIVEVITVDLPFKVIKTIAGEIEFEDEVLDAKNVFEKSKLSVMDKHPRYRKYIEDIMEMIFSFKMNKKSSPVIVLITINDNMKFKIIF